MSEEKRFSSRLSRRDFMWKGACAAVGTSGLINAFLGLRTLHAATATQRLIGGSGDYKALVCIFLYGGNDANNMIVPYGTTEYNDYALARQNLAIPRTDLLSLGSPANDSRSFGFHPSMGALHSEYLAGRAAVVANVGTLIAPVTRQQIRQGNPAVPPQLFSHNDQQVQWQTSLPGSSERIGFGGRMADLVAELNGANRFSTAISFGGTNIFQVGRDVLQYQMSDSGPKGIEGFRDNHHDQTRLGGIIDMIEMEHRHLFSNTFADISERGVENDRIIQQALQDLSPFTTVFPESGLGRQLAMVARLIAIRESLGLTRQIYFCATGGFDTHGEQVNAQFGLLGNVSDCMAAFVQATDELGVANNVTTFTASDFGRTYPSNGRGTDHGWGSHHLVAGGAVRGGQVYGTMPVLEVDGPDDTGTGRWIPTMATDEYFATMARWFGLADNDLTLALPNIGRFSRSNVGFMNT